MGRVYVMALLCLQHTPVHTPVCFPRSSWSLLSQLLQLSLLSLLLQLVPALSIAQAGPHCFHTPQTLCFVYTLARLVLVCSPLSLMLLHAPAHPGVSDAFRVLTHLVAFIVAGHLLLNMLK